MSYKTRFNRFYRQDAKKSNTFEEISLLTGIEINKIERKYSDIMKFPYIYGFHDCDLTLKLEQFARILVYKYALENKTKGFIKK